MLLVQANAFKIPLVDKSVHCAMTSPPYYSLRKYAGEQEFVFGGDKDCVHSWGGELVTKTSDNYNEGFNERYGNSSGQKKQEKSSYGELSNGNICRKCNAWRGAYGLEPTLQMYIDHTVEWCREVWRVLRDDGTFWLNLGDSYNSAPAGNKTPSGFQQKAKSGQSGALAQFGNKMRQPETGLKPKDLMGVPWRVALALQADGWYLRSDIIWCLSGGVHLYARTQNGDGVAMLRDLARLDPKTVKLWNGDKWTQVKGWSKSERKGDALELVLRSGERISCTPTHKFPTTGRGLLDAKSLVVGDVLDSCDIPEPTKPADNKHVGLDAAWFAGLYIAEGSRSGNTIQIAGHAKEEERWIRLNQIVADYGGKITRTVSGNKMDIRIWGKMLHALIDYLVSGKTAKNKGLAPVCWNYSNEFLQSLLDGYLSGDGHWEEKNKRWRLGFTRNYNLERDLRTLAARLQYNITLKPTHAKIGDKKYPSFKGELRQEWTAAGHWNRKNRNEVVEIRKARCRAVYDVGVEDDPHLFALASGVLTHNSKPNPMPESVTDRPTKSHEYLFLLTKSKTYYYDQDAIREPNTLGSKQRAMRGNSKDNKYAASEHMPPGVHANTMSQPREFKGYDDMEGAIARGETPLHSGGRNKRTVWTIATAPYKGAHFATYPPALVEPCIKAGTSEKGVCPECGNPWERVVERKGMPPVFGGKEYNGDKTHMDNVRKKNSNVWNAWKQSNPDKFLGWQPTCDHSPEKVRDPIPATVLDPYSGSGTTMLVARKLGRRAIGLDISAEYIELARERLSIKALEEWVNGIETKEQSYDDLPIFNL